MIGWDLNKGPCPQEIEDRFVLGCEVHRLETDVQKWKDRAEDWAKKHLDELEIRFNTEIKVEWLRTALKEIINLKIADVTDGSGPAGYTPREKGYLLYTGRADTIAREALNQSRRAQ